jgi:hypothetical protein
MSDSRPRHEALQRKKRRGGKLWKQYRSDNSLKRPKQTRRRERQNLRREY